MTNVRSTIGEVTNKVSTRLQELNAVLQGRDGNWIWDKLLQTLLVLLELQAECQAGDRVPTGNDSHVFSFTVMISKPERLNGATPWGLNVKL